MSIVPIVDESRKNILVFLDNYLVYPTVHRSLFHSNLLLNKIFPILEKTYPNLRIDYVDILFGFVFF